MVNRPEKEGERENWLVFLDKTNNNFRVNWMHLIAHSE